MANSQVIEHWKALEKALGQFAPKSLSCLNPGAQEPDFSALETQLGFKLSQDFIDFYSRHNGETPTEEALEPLFGFGYWMPLTSEEEENVLQEWATCAEGYGLKEAEELELTFEGPVQPVPFDRKWIPFCTDYAGNYLCLDFNPAEGGMPGQVLECDYDGESVIRVIADSIGDFLEEVAQELLSGERQLKPLERLEVVVRMEKIKTRLPNAVISTPTLEQMGVALKLLDPSVVNDPPDRSKRLKQPDVEPARYVAFSVYSTEDPSEKILSQSGGPIEISEYTLFQDGKRIEAAEVGLVHRRLDRKSSSVFPVFYLSLNAEISKDAGLEVTVTRG